MFLQYFINNTDEVVTSSNGNTTGPKYQMTMKTNNTTGVQPPIKSRKQQQQPQQQQQQTQQHRHQQHQHQHQQQTHHHNHYTINKKLLLLTMKKIFIKFYQNWVMTIILQKRF